MSSETSKKRSSRRTAPVERSNSEDADEGSFLVSSSDPVSDSIVDEYNNLTDT